MWNDMTFFLLSPSSLCITLITLTLNQLFHDREIAFHSNMHPGVVGPISSMP